ncbi:deacetylase SIR2 [Mycoplasma capricolum]|uniref:deacetylase SIR2 n=1 Tax=Mycoplasma capricolum TaxID=2095 RepID=UPI002FE09895|nr:Protein ADP-ribosyltransferase [Mycoplasma capricolum subsp. capripneumoniae]
MKKIFFDFIKEFKFIDFKQASVYPFLDISNYWAFFSKFIKLNYFDKKQNQTLSNLKNYLENKNYFILTTNSDQSLEDLNFDLNKIFELEAKYNLLECSKKCSNQLYTNDQAILNMANNQKNLKVDLELIPRCSNCNSYLKVHRRFWCQVVIEDERLINSKTKYQEFLNKYKNQKILFWEIGVNYNYYLTIKKEFWKMTEQFKNATYLAMNQKVYRIPLEIRSKTITYTDDIYQAINNLLEVKNDTYRTN